MQDTWLKPGANESRQAALICKRKARSILTNGKPTMSEPTPNYVTYPCQHCSGNIEFDANQLESRETLTVPCPHCGLETAVVGESSRYKVADTDSQTNRGVVLFQGVGGVPQDYVAAVKCFTDAAWQGHPDAQWNLGVCYHDGFGVEKNLSEAVKWWRAASEQGHSEAQFRLGLAYSGGDGIDENHSEAAKWMRGPAAKGNPHARHYLAIAFRFGDGVPQNYVEAYKWANLAAAQGIQAAADFRDELAQEMTSSQIEEGQRRTESETERLQQSASKRNSESTARQPIPAAVRREIWRRDEGKCARCGSRERLEYDHIVPLAKGGSNTARNIELLCESCNRSKSDSIQ